MHDDAIEMRMEVLDADLIVTGALRIYISGVATVGLLDPTGPRWTPSGRSGPKQTSSGQVDLAEVRIRFRIGVF